MAFTKLSKWAKEHNFPYELTTTVGDLPRIVITVSDSLSFIVENRKSSIYRSGRTGKLKGSRKGMYLEKQYNNQPSSAIYYATQQDIIISMGYAIR
ncbi:hypothetical protein CN918_29585 [Priestia megaterium]|nr:hypothetical protein CN918_29585 [Priestia megaterium]